MRIVTWNCYRGESHARAARLAPLRPDLTILQECAQPANSEPSRSLWFGSDPAQGVAAIAGPEWALDSGPIHPDVPDSMYPVRVSGPLCFHMLIVWAQRRPTYVRAVLSALDSYKDFIKSGPSVVVGDFNSHSRWDDTDRKANHSRLIQRLSDFDLVSAFHCTAGGSPEPPTLYWQWKQEQPFHVDYCFLPRSWISSVAQLKSAAMGNGRAIATIVHCSWTSI